MSKQHFLDLYTYNFALNRQVWNCAMTLTDEQFNQASSYSVGSVRNQLVHVMRVEHWWFYFLKTGDLQFLDEDTLTERGIIRQQWDETETMALAYLNAITPEELEREVRPSFWDEHIKPVPVYQALQQVANHSTDHRAQVLRLLYDYGATTLAQDYLYYLWDQQ